MAAVIAVCLFTKTNIKTLLQPNKFIEPIDSQLLLNYYAYNRVKDGSGCLGIFHQLFFDIFVALAQKSV